MNKTILLMGGSGDIGGAVARRFQQHGWDVHLLLRSFEKRETQELMTLAGVHAHKVNLEDDEKVQVLLETLRRDGVYPDEVFHGAGTFLWDDGYPLYSEPQPFEVIHRIVLGSNVATKRSVTRALDSVYGDVGANIHEIFVGSHAADFAADGPERTGIFSEEAYVEAMSLVKEMSESRSRDGRKVTLLQPGLINSSMAQKAFTPERIGFVVDWSTVQTPQAYAAEIFPESFFQTRL